MMNQLATSIGAVMLIGLGCLQMLGDLTQSKVLKAVGAASQASPAPKVFTAHDGFETFSSRFYLQWHSHDGVAHSLQLTPQIYGRLHGPYNRRNAYGAALSYGPVLAANPLTQPMFASVSRYALCGHAPVLRELGINTASIQGAVTVKLVPRDSASADGRWQLSFVAPCQLDKRIGEQS